MITLSKKIKEEKEKKQKGVSGNESRKAQRISVRDALLVKGTKLKPIYTFNTQINSCTINTILNSTEVQEMEEYLPCK